MGIHEAIGADIHAVYILQENSVDTKLMYSKSSHNRLGVPLNILFARLLLHNVHRMRLMGCVRVFTDL